MSTLGPKFYLKCHAPKAWNQSLLSDPSSSTEVNVCDELGMGWMVEVYSENLKKKLLSGITETFVAHLIREDGELMYLFESQLEREIFQNLNAIKGINVNVAATATSIVGSALLLEWVQGAPFKGYKFSGLGPKSIEKLVYEIQAKKAKFIPLLQAAKNQNHQGVHRDSGLGDVSAAQSAVSSSILIGLEKLGLRPADTLRLIDGLKAEDSKIMEIGDQALIAKILQKWGKEKWSSRDSSL